VWRKKGGEAGWGVDGKKELAVWFTGKVCFLLHPSSFCGVEMLASHCHVVCALQPLSGAG